MEQGSWGKDYEAKDNGQGIMENHGARDNGQRIMERESWSKR